MKQLLFKITNFRKQNDIKFTFKAYRQLCKQFDEELNSYINSNAIDYKLLYQVSKQVNLNNIGSTATMSKVIQILYKQNDSIQYQQQILALAGQLNICDCVKFNRMDDLNKKTLNLDALLYFSLIGNNSLVGICQQYYNAPIQVCYYLQMMNNAKYQPIQRELTESISQSAYASKINEPYESEKSIGLYYVDYYLPNSNKVIEINGYHHYHNFGERRTGQYQQKYNYLVKEQYDVLEVRHQ